MANNISVKDSSGATQVVKTTEVSSVHTPHQNAQLYVNGQAVTNLNPVSVDTGLTPLTNTELRATAVPVSGPLTDAQLRATAVPVSGPLTDAQLRATSIPVTTGGLTDAELRATPIPVTSNGLTNTELRATAVPVTGPLTDAQLRASSIPVTSNGLTDAELRADPISIVGETAVAIRMLNALIAPLAYACNQANGKLRVDVAGETLGTVTTVSTVTTVTTVSTVSAVTNLAQIGSIAANSLILDAMYNQYANGVRANIT
jgi:hypothetical protein